MGILARNLRCYWVGLTTERRSVRKERDATISDAQSDKLARAYARLQALKDNMPKGHLVYAAYIQEYHEALRHLEELGFDVAEFKLPSRRFMRVVPVVGELTVERALFLSKLDAVLTYFELVTQTPPARIGFRPSSQRE